jgi:hypothetical protein
MDTVQEPSNSECHTPSPEPFRIDSPLLRRVQTGSRAHPQSYPMGTGWDFAGSKVTAHPHLVPRWRMMELYLHSRLCRHGLGTILPSHYCNEFYDQLCITKWNPYGWSSCGLSEVQEQKLQLITQNLCQDNQYQGRNSNPTTSGIQFWEALLLVPTL